MAKKSATDVRELTARASMFLEVERKETDIFEVDERRTVRERFIHKLPVGELMGPGGITGQSMKLRLDPLTEHIFWAGAAPAEGANLFQQVRRGPWSWIMLISCMYFAVPGIVHLCFRQHWMDYVSGITLLILSVTSSLCDAFCVDCAVYDDGVSGLADGRPYQRTAEATGTTSDVIVKRIKENAATPEVLAPDGWKNFTRLLDRFWVCVFTVPLLAYFFYFQRPSFLINIPFVMGTFGSFALNIKGQSVRASDPCGIRYQSGRYLVEERYWFFMKIHAMWHFLMSSTLIVSALYRPAF